MSGKRMVKKYATEIFSEPWLTRRFDVSNLHEADAVKKIIKNCGLSYHHYSGNYVADTIVMFASAEMKQKYIQTCCSKYLIDDISKIICEYLEHGKK